jgi:hypothetical protein
MIAQGVINERPTLTALPVQDGRSAPDTTCGAVPGLSRSVNLAPPPSEVHKVYEPDR